MHLTQVDAIYCVVRYGGFSSEEAYVDYSSNRVGRTVACVPDVGTRKVGVRVEC